MGAVTDPGADLQDDLAEIRLSGADGLHARFSPLYATLAGNVDHENIDLADNYDWTGIHTFQSTDFHILSSGAAFDLILAVTTVFTGDRTLALNIGDANRNLTLLSNLSIGSSAAVDVANNAAVDINNPLTISRSTVVGVIDKGNLGATPAFNYNDGNVQQGTLNTNITGATITNLPDGGIVAVFLKQDATGNRTVNWSTSIAWAGGGTEIEPTATANRGTLYVFRRIGSIIIGNVGAYNVPTT